MDPGRGEPRGRGGPPGPAGAERFALLPGGGLEADVAGGTNEPVGGTGARAFSLLPGGGQQAGRTGGAGGAGGSDTQGLAGAESGPRPPPGGLRLLQGTKRKWLAEGRTLKEWRMLGAAEQEAFRKQARKEARSVQKAERAKEQKRAKNRASARRERYVRDKRLKDFCKALRAAFTRQHFNKWRKTARRLAKVRKWQRNSRMNLEQVRLSLWGGPEGEIDGAPLGRGRRRAIRDWLLEQERRTRARIESGAQAGTLQNAGTHLALGLPLGLPRSTAPRLLTSVPAWRRLVEDPRLVRRMEMAAPPALRLGSQDNPPGALEVCAHRMRKALERAAQWERQYPGLPPALRGRALLSGVSGDWARYRRRSLLMGWWEASRVEVKFYTHCVYHRKVLEQLLMRFLLERDFKRLARVALVLLSSRLPGDSIHSAHAGETMGVYSLFPAARCGLEALLRCYSAAGPDLSEGAAQSRLPGAFSAFLLKVRSKMHAVVKTFHPAAQLGEYGESLELRSALVHCNYTEAYIVTRRRRVRGARGRLEMELQHTHPERAYIALSAHQRLLDTVREVWHRDPASPREPPDLVGDLGDACWSPNLSAHGVKVHPGHRPSDKGWKQLVRKSLEWGAWWQAVMQREPQIRKVFEEAEAALRHAIELDAARGNGLLLRLLQIFLLAGQLNKASRLLEVLAQDTPPSPAVLGTICAFKCSQAGGVDEAAFAAIQRVSPAHPGVFSILLGTVPVRTEVDVRRLVRGLFLVLDSDPLHFEAWRNLALIICYVKCETNDGQVGGHKVCHFVHTQADTGDQEPLDWKVLSKDSCWMLPGDLRQEVLRSLAKEFASRRHWWRRFHLTYDAVFSCPLPAVEQSATAATGRVAAKVSGEAVTLPPERFSGSWLKCINFLTSLVESESQSESESHKEEIKLTDFGTALKEFGFVITKKKNHRTKEVEVLLQWKDGDSWRAPATVPAPRSLRISCFWGTKGKMTRKSMILLRTSEDGVARLPVASLTRAGEPQSRLWTESQGFQSFSL